MVLWWMAFPRPVQAQLPEHIIGRPCDACNPQTVYPADLDGDGDEDVLFTAAGDDKIAWYENQTGEVEADDDEFGSAQTIASIPSPGAGFFAFAADLDGDGDLDVIANFRGTTNSNIAWFENLGEGSFAAQKSIVGTWGVNTIDAADLDGDGDLDLIVADEPRTDVMGKIAWYENKTDEPDADGDGFSSQNIITANLEHPATDVALADFDGDNDLDVVAGSREEITWYKNQIGEQDADDDGFSSKFEIAPRSSSIGLATSVIADDFDGDGDPDVAAFDQDSNSDSELIWHENLIGEPDEDLDGFSTKRVIATYPPFRKGTPGIESSDLDGDGDPDIVANRPDFTWYENQHGEPEADFDGFGSAQAIADDEVGAFYPADVDGDSDPDLLSAIPGEDRVAWHENKGDGSFAPARVMSTTATSNGPFYAVSHDFTGDGDLDVLVASHEDDQVTLYQNQGGGLFGNGQTVAADLDYPDYTGAMSSQSVTLGDFDGDGDLDFLTVEDDDDEYIDESIAWLENQIKESGALAPRHAIYNSTTQIEKVLASDLDSDGDQDVLSIIDGENVWFENQGDGTFTPPQTLPVAYEESVVSIADLDGDGDPDLLTETAWHENQIGEPSAGDAPFDRRWVIDDNGSIRMAADLDGDDDPDAIGTGPDPLVWYENQHGERTADNDRFSDARTISSDAQFSIDKDPLAVADLDGDGDTDVLTIQSGRVYWHENRLGASDADGEGFEPAFALTPVTSPIYSFSTGDIDGDDDPDLLLAAPFADKIAWYETSTEALSVELVAFTATIDDETVRLAWETASEANNAGFHVERRTGTPEGSQSAWQRLGFVEGAGTTDRPQSYRYEDTNLPGYEDADLPGGALTLTYRLRQVNLVGGHEYSPTVEVQIEPPERVALKPPFPNPARESVTISYELPQAIKVQLEVFDVLGRRVGTLVSDRQDAGSKQANFDFSGLASGTYIIRLQAGEHDATRRITVVR